MKDSVNSRKRRIEVRQKMGYNKVFEQFQNIYTESLQTPLFDDIGRKVITACLKGVNSTIFAYGQTSSGKTYTMFGSKEGKFSIVDLYKPLFHVFPIAVIRIIHQFLGTDTSKRGLIFRILMDLVSRKEESEQNGGKFSINVSMSELYNEQYRELIETTKIKDSKHAESIIDKGMQKRVTKPTIMNPVSSRSHALFVIHVSVTPKGKKKTLKGCINLVDLAGSEKSGTFKKERLKEGIKINKSLLCLGMVIDKLVEKSIWQAKKRRKSKKKKKKGVVKEKKEFHVPYYNSILTLMLMDSLSLDNFIVMLANVSPCKDSVGESMNTLNYASRTTKIKLK